MLYADYTDMEIQNVYYKGYTCSVEMANLLAYNFKGEIMHAAIFYTSSSHDSKLAFASSLINTKLSDEMAPCGLVILGDSAFVTIQTNGKVVRKQKTNEAADILTEVVIAAIDMILQHVMQSER